MKYIKEWDNGNNNFCLMTFPLQLLKNFQCIASKGEP